MAKITGLTDKHVDHLIAKFDTVMLNAAKQTFAMAAHNITFASKPSIVAAVSNPGETEFPEEASAQFISDTALSVIQLEWLSHVTDEILPFLGKVYLQGAMAITVNVKENVSIAGNVALPEVGAEAAEQFLIAASNRVKVFSARMWQVAKQELTDGVSKGQSIEKIAGRVANATSITQKKAHVIAQTEVISAVNAGEFAQMRTLASTFDFVTSKEWVATHDTHTRPSHLAANGQKVALNEKFDVGQAYLDFPGDPTGPASEIISCRCTTVYEVADSDEISQPQTSPGALSAAGLLDTTEQFSPYSYDEMLMDLCAIVAAGWNPAAHPRGKDGKFIKKGFLPDSVLEALKVNKVDAAWEYTLAQELNELTPTHWAKLTDGQKEHLNKIVEQLHDTNTPGSYKAATHLEDLEDLEDLETDLINKNEEEQSLLNDNFGDDETDLFNPDNELPSKSATNYVGTVLHSSFTKNEWDKLSPESKAIIKKGTAEEVVSSTGEDIPHAINALKKIQEFEKNVTPDPVPTPQKSTPIKITHALIHAKYQPGEIIAQTNKKDGTPLRIQWNGKEYSIQLQTSTGSWLKSPNTIKKSALYAHLASKYPDAQWVKPGKQDNDNSALNIAATLPEPNVIPTPVAAAPLSTIDMNNELLMMDVVEINKKWFAGELSDNEYDKLMKVHGGGVVDVDADPDSAAPTVVTQNVDLIDALINNTAPTVITQMIDVTDAPVMPKKITIQDLNSLKKSQFYNAFKNEKVSPAWSGAKIYASIQAAKQKFASDPEIANASDDTLLNLVDQQLNILGKNKSVSKTPYHDKVIEWLKTPNGKKAAKAAKSVGPTTAPITTNVVAPAPVSTSSAPVPIPGAPEAAQSILSGDADIGNIGDKASVDIYTKFKSHGSAAYVDTDPETLFKTAHTVTDGTNLTAGQVLKIVDVQGAKKFGVENKFMFETKVKTHLQDPNNLLDATHVVPISEAKFLHNAPSAATVVDLAPQPSGTKAEILAKSSSDFKVKTTTWAIKTFDDIIAAAPFKTGQKQALRDYTGNSYSSMNAALRKKTGVDPTMLKRLNDAQAGMRPLPEDILVHRGTSFSQFGNIKSAEEAKQLVGKTLQDKAFMSTSVGGSSAFGGAVAMEIEVPKGTGVMYVDTFSKHKGEKELMLSAGLRYRVLSVTPKSGYGGGVTVRVRIIPPPDGSV